MAPITIGSNVQSINAQRRLENTSSSLQKVYERLSSGRRINSASDDPAGLTIADRLNADQRLATTAIRNTNDGISALTVADSALEEIGNVLSRLAELSQQAANGVYSTAQRSALDAEFSALGSEIDRVASATVFNGFGLVSGGNAIVLQIGLDATAASRIQVNAVTGTMQGLGLSNTSSVQIYSLNGISATEGSSSSRLALDAVNRAIGSLSALRGQLGATDSRLQTAVKSLSSIRQNYAAAESRVRDTDVAADAAEVTRLNILQQAGSSILAQANQIPSLALKLLG